MSTDSRLTITYPGMDDCDAATLAGIVRRALEADPNAFLRLADKPALHVTRHRTMSDDDVTEAWTFTPTA